MGFDEDLSSRSLWRAVQLAEAMQGAGGPVAGKCRACAGGAIVPALPDTCPSCGSGLRHPRGARIRSFLPGRLPWET